MAGVSAGETLEGIGEPGERVDVIELGSFDEAGDDRPVVAAVVGAGEERVLAIEGQCPFILPMSGIM